VLVTELPVVQNFPFDALESVDIPPEHIPRIALDCDRANDAFSIRIDSVVDDMVHCCLSSLSQERWSVLWERIPRREILEWIGSTRRPHHDDRLFCWDFLSKLARISNFWR